MVKVSLLPQHIVEAISVYEGVTMSMSDFVYRYYRTNSVNIMVVYSWSNNRYMFFDGVSAEVLEATFAEDKQRISLLLKQNDISEDEYKSFLCLIDPKGNSEKYEKIGIEDNHFEEDKIYKEIYNAGFLYAFHFDITHKCNLRCKHCYHTFDEYSRDQDLTIFEIKELFQILRELGVFKVTLSGGEPLLREDLEEILCFADECNFVCEIYSNATLLNREILQMLKCHNVSKLSFSCYGFEKSSAEITGCKDFFAKLEQAITLCKEENMPFELKYPVTKENISEIQTFRAYCKEKNIRLSFEICLTPKLNGNTDNLSCKISCDEYRRMILENSDIMLYKAVNLQADEEIMCNAGRLSLYCDYRGCIYPCVSYRRKLGDYTELKTIWDDIIAERILPIPKHSDYPSFGTHSYCKYCYEICPALSMLENGSYGDCENSGCEIAKIVEEIHLLGNSRD